MRFATRKMAESGSIYNNKNNYCFDRQDEYATRPLYRLKRDYHRILTAVCRYLYFIGCNLQLEVAVVP